jgi:ferredoxin
LRTPNVSCKLTKKYAKLIVAVGKMYFCQKKVSDNIIYIKVLDRRGVEHNLEAPTDMNFNLMELCRAHELPVEGTCGGMALCASCHIYILSEHVLSEATDDEEAMLDQAFFVKNNSRLGCQIQLSQELDGLRVELAPQPD